MYCFELFGHSNFQDVDQWGQYDGRGRPLGPGCFVDMSTVAEGFPTMTFKQASEKYHDKTNALFRPAYNAARAIKVKLLKGESVTPVRPPSSVQNNTTRAVTVYVEMGFVTESDLIRLFKVGASALKMGKRVSLKIEDGTPLQGWLINLRGMPAAELASMRRVRIEHRAAINLQEKVLQAAQQIRAEQGADVWEVACGKQDQATAQGALSSKSRYSLPTLGSLQEKAQAVLEDWPCERLGCLNFK